MKAKKKILIIEDDTLFSEFCSDFLKKEGFLVFTAIDGEQGVEKARKEKPDLILLDIILPKMTGYEVLKEIRKNVNSDLAKVPVIILTNLSQEKGKFEGLGIECYLIKVSTDAKEVIKKVKRVFKRKS